MPRNYYYLVSGLPDIVLDDAKKNVSFASFMAEIRELIAPEDRALIATLRYQYDNTNLLALLNSTQGHVFDQRGNYSKDELEREIKFPERIPQYMQRFLAAWRDEKMPFGSLAAQDQLLWLYYDEMTSHPNAFLRAWFSADLHLRNLLAGINCRAYAEDGGGQNAGFSRARAIIGSNDIAATIRRSTSADFSVGQALPWAEKILALDRADLVAFEKNVDMVRWGILGELTTFSYFQIETILAFIIKLSLVERWQALESGTGRERLESILAGFASSYTITEENY
jgi:hypothetical protein